MKTPSNRSLRRLLLKTSYYADYTDQVYELEKALARKPQRFQVDIVGSGELSPDTALLMRAVLLGRSSHTHLVTNARSSLQGGTVLVWLLGDTRRIRDDAKLYLRRPNRRDPDEDAEAWKDEESRSADQDLEEADYGQVLQHINAFLPVKEFVGRAIDLAVMKQFGLVDSQGLDTFLASALGKSENATGPPQRQSQMKSTPVPVRKRSRRDRTA